MADIKFKLGIVGAGTMGVKHLNVAVSSHKIDVIGIYDTDVLRANKLANEYKTKAYESIKSLANDVDGIILAVPSFLHAELGIEILNYGKHLLIEKPIALLQDDAQKLIDLANEKNVLLLVGHIEQYNATFLELVNTIKDDEIFDGYFSRLATQAGRDKSATIVLDLMIHDLELGISLGGKIKDINAFGGKIKYEFIDHANAVITFENGTTFRFIASAVSHMRDRTITLFGHKRTYIANLGGFTLTTMETGVNDDNPVIKNIEPQNALLNEIEHFAFAAENSVDLKEKANNALLAITAAKKIEEIIENGVKL